MSLNEQHQAQLLNYLFLLGLPRCKLINFRTPKVQGRIHATSLSAKDRHQIVIDLEHWEDLSNACSQLRLRYEGFARGLGGFSGVRTIRASPDAFLRWQMHGSTEIASETGSYRTR